MNTDTENKTKGERGVMRRFYGGLAALVGITMSGASGFEFYSPNEMTIWAVFSAAFILLGIGNVTDIWKAK